MRWFEPRGAASGERRRSVDERVAERVEMKGTSHLAEDAMRVWMVPSVHRLTPSVFLSDLLKHFYSLFLVQFVSLHVAGDFFLLLLFTSDRLVAISK